MCLLLAEWAINYPFLVQVTYLLSKCIKGNRKGYTQVKGIRKDEYTVNTPLSRKSNSTLVLLARCHQGARAAFALQDPVSTNPGSQKQHGKCGLQGQQ